MEPHTLIGKVILPLTELPLPIPKNTFFQLYPITSEAIQSTADGEVDLATAQLLHEVQVIECSRASSIRDRNITPLSQLLNEFFVDPFL